MPFEVYDADSSEWSRFPSIQRFRHACWTLDNIIYVYGGFEQESPNVPTETIARADLSKYFSSNAYLTKYLLNFQPKNDYQQTQTQLGMSGKGATFNKNDQMVFY